MSKTVVYGGAGCGKTTYLINEVVQAAGGVHLRNICMMTLTRNARDEFVKRTMEATGAQEKEMKWFSTMHSIAWKLSGLTGENFIAAKDITRFKDEYGYSVTPNLFNKLCAMDGACRNCCCEPTAQGFTQTERLTGVDSGYKNDDSKRWSRVSIDELLTFSGEWNSFMECDEVYDYTGAIERAIDVVTSDGFISPFTKLFVDEFQDFSPLQHKLFVKLSECVDDVYVCGDDWQTIYRFSGARPEYLIDGEWDETVVLPKTYRYGAAILENSLKYIGPLTEKFDRDIEPADHDSVCEHLQYDDWTLKAKGCVGDTVYLARSAKGVAQISKRLDELGVQHTILGEQSASDKMVMVYNTVVALHNGESVPPSDVKRLIDHLTQKVSSKIFGKKDVPYLQKGVKKRVKDEIFIESPDRVVWDTDTFTNDFLVDNTFDAREMISHIKGMNKLTAREHVVFPTAMSGVNHTTKHRVGTIHKFKGNEADTVFLFAQLPYPFSKQVQQSPEYKDDELRTFYVGATRARHTLYEISNYIVSTSGYNKGTPCLNMSMVTV